MILIQCVGVWLYDLMCRLWLYCYLVVYVCVGDDASKREVSTQPPLMKQPAFAFEIASVLVFCQIEANHHHY